MIGALLAQRLAVRGFRNIARKDLAAVLRGVDEHAILEIPGRTAVSGRFEGKPEIERFFRTWFGRMERIRFHLRHVCVGKPLALGASNTVVIEWDVEETDVDGVAHRFSGVTVVEVRRGRTVRAREYVFDQDAFARAWPGPPGVHAARSDGRP